MITRIEITIAGTPRARPRANHRAVRTKGGKYIAVAYHPQARKAPRIGSKYEAQDLRWARANQWYDAVRSAITPHLPAAPWTGPVHFEADVYFERPKYMQAKTWPDGPILHTATPDRDNLDKSLTDPAKVAGLYQDDCQICSGEVRKWYAARGCGPGVRIVTYAIGPGHPGYCDRLHGPDSTRRQSKKPKATTQPLFGEEEP